MDDAIPFRPVQTDDRTMIQRHTYATTCRNCDLSFMNLCSRQFYYHTEVAEWGEWLLFRFQAQGRLAYLLPVGEGDLRIPLQALRADARRRGEPFLLLGVCECFLPRMEAALPGFFRFENFRAYSDYIYERQALATLGGKKLQSKRNFVNRFYKKYPDARYCALTPELIPLCRDLEERWMAHKPGYADDPAYIEERRAMYRVFDHWEEIDGRGGVLLVGNRAVAFTYGSPINHDTYDICLEKADVDYEGAFAVINKEFAASLPAQYVYVNREEDLGLPGLRRAKESYHPAFLLHKYAATERSSSEEEYERTGA